MQRSIDRRALCEDVARRVRVDLQHDVPALVNLHLGNLFQSCIANRPDFQGLLDAHTTSLTCTLEETARRTLDRIVNEDQYHSVADAHIHAQEERFNAALANQNAAFHAKLGDMSRLDQPVRDLQDDMRRNWAGMELGLAWNAWNSLVLGIFIYTYINGPIS